MSRLWDSAVSREAWDRLANEYRELDNAERCDDTIVADLLRDAMLEVEGIPR